MYLKAAPRFELGIENLQSTALPLGHTAINKIHYLLLFYIIIKNIIFCNFIIEYLINYYFLYIEYDLKFRVSRKLIIQEI